ncbi:MAG TPA: hypothetical protein VJ385_15520 [Fibrobacteria bacterium]|nr:hypothetical protein [Fibrobacteria bacterium]
MTERKNGRFVAEERRSSGGGDWSRSGRRAEPETIALNRILGSFSFPASKEAITRQLAIDAFIHDGGRAAELHDLVVQLDGEYFRGLEDLQKAIKDRHAWEKTHDVLA